MGRSDAIRLTALEVPEEWDDDDTPKLDGYQGNPENWQIWDWAKVMGFCAGEDVDLTFDSEIVKGGGAVDCRKAEEVPAADSCAG
ncbi:hypothetical protein AXG93_738s1000 [Marchantia polymorpha subsp. ruderalis]|uniref:Uncharacterized protein n=1 Tax=Marchantia polymorpha subsp. ruderalis TaxID=1480154 RepID=A0A176W1T7_MARPO|nr:hypothetical protein AXG93_738s1000 [Marchantia polymorpha subsp. ruderalis]